jgi:hypothetical protein
MQREREPSCFRKRLRVPEPSARGKKVKLGVHATRARRPADSLLRALDATELEFRCERGNTRNRNVILAVTQPFSIAGDKVNLGRNLSPPNNGAHDRMVLLIPSQNLHPTTKR